MPYSDVSPSEEREIVEMAETFDSSLVMGVWDWGSYKLGLRYGLFDTGQRATIEAFFRLWPKAWAVIRPHFENPEGMRTLKPADRFADRLESYFGITGEDSFRHLISLTPGESPSIRGLGIAPLIIIAGIALLAVLGIGGALWAVGYWKEQGNITLLIDGVVRGVIDESVLHDAVNKENQSIFGEVAEGFTSLALLVVVGGGLWLFSNILSSAGVFRKAQHA